MRDRIQILGVTIDPLTMNETIDIVEQNVLEKRPLHLMGVNADKINQCHTDEKIKKSLMNQESLMRMEPQLFLQVSF